MQIKDKVFIVTGGASGLGEAAVRQLVTQGARVVIADVASDKGQAISKRLGDQAQFVQCDITQEADGQACIAAALTKGALHGLINCAGIAPAEKTVGKEGPHQLASFMRAVSVNLVGSFNMTRLAAYAMSSNTPSKDGERGVIINTASIAAFDGQMGQVAYAASKGGVVSMTLPLARDLARHGIRVMTIAPGIFETPLLLAMPDEVRASLGKQVPFPSRLGQPQEFAQLVEAIILNPMLNGTTIRLDGAIRMQPK